MGVLIPNRINYMIIRDLAIYAALISKILNLLFKRMSLTDKNFLNNPNNNKIKITANKLFSKNIHMQVKLFKKNFETIFY